MSSACDATRVAARLHELEALQDGWLDGDGLAPPAEGLRWLCLAWATHLQHRCPAPFAYPTVEGGVSLEWDTAHRSVSLEVDLRSRQARLLVIELDVGNASESVEQAWAFADSSALSEADQWREVAALLVTALT